MWILDSNDIRWTKFLTEGPHKKQLGDLVPQKYKYTSSTKKSSIKFFNFQEISYS